MPTGGLAPLPLRLGADPEYGWTTAEQHARLCADLVALTRVSPVFVADLLSLAYPGVGDDVYFTSYYGRNGEGLQYAPRTYALFPSPDYAIVGFAPGPNNLGYTVDLSGYVGSHWCAVASARSYTVASVMPQAVLGGYITAYLAHEVPLSISHTASLVLWDSGYTSAIGDYGGSVDKTNSPAEGASTYASRWYGYLRDCQGSAYTTVSGSVRSWALLAYARALGTSQRIDEMLAASGTPTGSDALLGRWAAILGVQTSSREDWALREDCEVRYAYPDAPTHAYLTTALGALLEGYASVYAITNTSAGFGAWPSGAYWSEIVAGPAWFDLSGDGMFASPRARVVITVTPATAVTVRAVAGMMSRDVTEFLDRALPATAEWSWEAYAAATPSFILDTSGLDTGVL